MRYFFHGHEARQVDARDYDGMCETAAWCRGSTVDDGEYVIIMPTPIPHEAVRVKAGAWIVRDATSGIFYVHDEPQWRPAADPWPWFLPQPGDEQIVSHA